MLRTLFIVDSFVATAYGLALLAAPDFMLHLYGLGGTVFQTRLLGAFVLGQGPLLWFARDETATTAGIAITRGHGIIDAVSTVLCVTAILQGAMNAQGWVVAILFALFGSARLYYGFIRQPAVTATA
jgi:hypothetical protein